mmetsp:Transcript_13444/g.27289  ORF Transcript_13444/g.27289 Transcript_13444/m.27289 type:complete len:704 (+) Transcript_13444:138-2249(+)
MYYRFPTHHLLSTIMTAALTVTITMSRGSIFFRRASAFQHTGHCYLTNQGKHLQLRNNIAAPLAAYSTIPSESESGQGFEKNNNDKTKSSNNNNWKIVDVPLVFVPGMKGTHLAFEDDDKVMVNKGKKKKKTRAWLTLPNLLNFPPKPDGYFERDLSLPLTYDSDGRQHRGPLVPDGIVDHIIEFSGSSEENDNDGTRAKNFVDLNFLPFYGHTTRLLKEMDRQYHLRKHDGKDFSTETFEQEDEETTMSNKNKGIFDRVGRFVERTSNWAFANTTDATADEQEAKASMHVHCRPTAVFTYDWRRSLPELCTDLHTFCEETFPNQKVQILAHSMGGLMSFACMRKHPEKYEPGAVVVGVPFDTGTQYLQDLHKGYYTELDRCRQFKPESQFTMSSHWAFFPISKKQSEDRLVDVTNSDDIVKFDADKSGIGLIAPLQPNSVQGENAYFDYYNPDEWERLQLGIFGPEYDDKVSDEERVAYKAHMKIQMDAAKQWRKDTFREDEDEEDDMTREPVVDPNFPPFVACQSNTIPIVNQYLRRKRKVVSQNTVTRKGRHPFNEWEYDYINGRSVPGDGRIDYDGSFPPSFVSHKRITLGSPHTKQMCWEQSGGSLGTVYKEVISMTEDYLDLLKRREQDAEVRSHLLEEEILTKNNKRGKSIAARIARKARKLRIRRRRADKEMSEVSGELAVATRPRRFSFRRRRG